VSTTSCLQSPNANKKLQKGKWTGASGEPPLIECEILSLPAVINHLKTNVAAALSAIRNGSKFGGVNYTGKIIFAGPYDPFGAVFTPGVELDPGSKLPDFRGEPRVETNCHAVRSLLRERAGRSGRRPNVPEGIQPGY
jgi:hypothetical protein